MTFFSLDVFKCIKTLPFLFLFACMRFVLFVIFVLFVLFVLFVRFVLAKSFRKKIKRFEIALMTSFTLLLSHLFETPKGNNFLEQKIFLTVAPKNKTCFMLYTILIIVKSFFSFCNIFCYTQVIFKEVFISFTPISLLFFLLWKEFEIVHKPFL